MGTRYIAFYLITMIFGLCSFVQAQTIHYSGDCFDITISNILVNGQSAETLRVEPGTPLQVNFTITIDPDGCWDISPTSILFGFHGLDGVQYGRCLYSNDIGIHIGGSAVTTRASFTMPGPDYSGQYFLNFSKSSTKLTTNASSSLYGNYISPLHTDSTAKVLQVAFGTPDDPWNSNGSFLYYNTGNVGIGTSTPSTDYKLSVSGNLRAKKVVVETGWADHVFEEGYPLPTLDSVRAYVARNGHLPGIPSAAEIEEKGLDVGSVQRDMMAKIEELTLYMLEMQAENERLRKRVEALEGKDAGLKPEENTIEGGNK